MTDSENIIITVADANRRYPNWMLCENLTSREWGLFSILVVAFVKNSYHWRALTEAELAPIYNKHFNSQYLIEELNKQ